MATQDLASYPTGSKAVASSRYDVFINFRGEDTRKNFTSFLYRTLKDRGINAFLDSEKLWTGEAIAPALSQAIKGSKIAIPIFSKGYVDSKWCLMELTQIVECHRSNKQIILPIFFFVDPSDVRNQTGIFENAFMEHQKKFEPSKVQSWREALRVVGNLKGEVIDNTTDQAELVELLVKRALRELVDGTRLAECEYLVDMNSKVKDLLSLLAIGSNDVQFVGICGFGGIGKTTLAKAIYNDILSTFQKHCFLSNVREQAAQIEGLVSLQKQFLKDIIKEDPDTRDCDRLKRLIEERVSQENVLLVLDDVDRKEQIDALAERPNWFGPGSRVIITTRDENILNLAEVNRNKIYKPLLLNHVHSLQLFCWHAFKRIQPHEDYVYLSKAIVKIIGGVPLARRVIASSLFSKNKPLWEEMLKKLQKIPHNDVMERLKISYDGLGHQEQQMFLDTACFFIGMKKDIACYIWESCDFFPQIGLDVLCAKSLMTINEDDELRMHDVLRDLGREIVRQENTEPGTRSRIWSNEEALDVLADGKGTNKCVGLAIGFRQPLKSEGLDAMTELRILQLDYVEILGECRNSFSQLRWLSWKGCHGLFALTKFCPRKLVILDLSKSEMTEKWMGWDCIKMAVNLKVLKANHCMNLCRTPDLSGNPLLEVLNFQQCHNLIGVHTSIGYLKNLVTLDMMDCQRLVDVAIKGCELASIRTLDLSGCISLKKLPDIPPSLTTLAVSNCYSLQNIPFGHPSSLSSLTVRYCPSVSYISGLPSSLRNLHVSYCGSLVQLSEGGGWRNLKTLHLSFCESLKEIEGADNKLESLEKLFISNCSSLKKLPKLRCSRNLLGLTIRGTDMLSDFEGEGMDSLEELKIRGCHSLKKIPYLRDSKWLRELHIIHCRNLKALSSEDILTLKNLKHLYIWYCMSMERLPDLSNLKELTVLGIQGCDKISEIVGLDGLESLQELEIINCHNLSRIQGVERLESLKTLWIQECCSLERLPDLSSLKYLGEVHIQECRNIPDQSIPKEKKKKKKIEKTKNLPKREP